MEIPSSETHFPLPKPNSQIELVNCDSCGFTEECTLAYISRIRDKFNGRWICGLCIEAVKYEALRSGMVINTEEALIRHISFCKKFQSSSPPLGATEHLISAVRRVLRRSLDSPRSMPNSPMREIRRPRLVRSESCFSSLSR
ncbi:uncharacterized protein LOC130795404 [Actinidia eriantha]|uniref:uncharacterized protein LOC130795404 n=1 Tax=Actinidia eriantha TaxID=165200 RepID=UPI0025888E72|nr:uncharacterized protein LOC130795404 [Actinidia eriantha]